MATTYVDRDRAPARSSNDEQRPKADEGGLKGKLLGYKERLERYAVFRVLESTAQGFTKDHVPDQAAAMTYYGVFSLFPLILLFMSLAGLALQSNDTAREQIMNVVVGLLPQGQDALLKMIGDVIKAKGAAAGIGLLALLWSALGWFQVIDTNINRIWGVSKPRSFVMGKLFAVAMIVAIGGVALLSFGATAAINLLSSFTSAIPGSVAVWQAAVSALTVLTIALAFFVLYRYAPQRRVQVADVWPAALTTAVLWEITRQGLAVYLERTDMISGYGPIGAAMALLFWIYVASIIVLVGAELTYAIAKERRHLEPEEQMKVVAPPGEQPTPKFAPQVGEGASTGTNEKEPTHAYRPAADGAPAGHLQVAAQPSEHDRQASGRGPEAGTGAQHTASPAHAGRDPLPKRLLATAFAAALGLVLTRRHRSSARAVAHRAESERRLKRAA